MALDLPLFPECRRYSFIELIKDRIGVF